MTCACFLRIWTLHCLKEKTEKEKSSQTFLATMRSFYCREPTISVIPQLFSPSAFSPGISFVDTEEKSAFNSLHHLWNDPGWKSFCHTAAVYWLVDRCLSRKMLVNKLNIQLITFIHSNNNHCIQSSKLSLWVLQIVVLKDVLGGKFQMKSILPFLGCNVSGWGVSL